MNLVTCDKLLKGVGHLISEDTEADRLGFLKETANKEGVILRAIDVWQAQDWIQPDSIVVLDFFGLNPIEYRPFLLSNSAALSKAKKLFIYHSHLQDEEVSQQLEGLKELEGGLPLQLWPEHPVEVLVEKDEEGMLNRLMNFFKEDSERPEKQDTVIFFPVDTHVKRFASKLNEQLAKQHLRETVNLILKPNQPQSKAKNNVFLVSSAAQLTEWDYDYSQLFYAVDF